MSGVSLPSSKVREALIAAAASINADGDKLTARFLKTRRWSWRKLRSVDVERRPHDALRIACDNSMDGWRWKARKDAFNAAAEALYPLCRAAETIEVSAEHFAAIAGFFQA